MSAYRSWHELTAQWPIKAPVRSLVDDGMFVQVGSEGQVVGREQRDSNLLVTVLWLDTDTRSRHWARELERVDDDMEATA